MRLLGRDQGGAGAPERIEQPPRRGPLEPILLRCDGVGGVFAPTIVKILSLGEVVVLEGRPTFRQFFAAANETGGLCACPCWAMLCLYA